MLKARHQHALECYSTTEQRARGLRQWIQMVIDQIINKDLQAITAKVSRAAHQLRVERIRLMKVGLSDAVSYNARYYSDHCRGRKKL